MAVRGKFADDFGHVVLQSPKQQRGCVRTNGQCFLDFIEGDTLLFDDGVPFLPLAFLFGQRAPQADGRRGAAAREVQGYLRGAVRVVPGDKGITGFFVAVKHGQENRLLQIRLADAVGTTNYRQRRGQIQQQFLEMTNVPQFHLVNFHSTSSLPEVSPNPAGGPPRSRLAVLRPARVPTPPGGFEAPLSRTRRATSLGAVRPRLRGLGDRLVAPRGRLRHAGYLRCLPAFRLLLLRASSSLPLCTAHRCRSGPRHFP